ncbi:MAG: DNA alkylation repair protein [Gemmatimonadaceae bacterium]
MNALGRLMELRNPKDAEFLQRFFKTGEGQYGAGDRFLGIRVPAQRKLARELRGLPLAEVAELLDEDWHEARLLALMLLADGYERGDDRTRERIFKLYLAKRARVNNWDLVDTSASYIIGRHLEGRPRDQLLRLAKSKSLWDRRIAIVATHYFIRQDDFADTLKIAALLLDDDEDLMHKATGWMLREVGIRDLSALDRFLDEHAHEMPRTMLRYAIEKHTPARRKHYMASGRRRS